MSVPECLAKTLLPGTVWPVQVVFAGALVLATGLEEKENGKWLISHRDRSDPDHYHIRLITPTEEQRRARLVP
jgi:hypothetical protein